MKQLVAMLGSAADGAMLVDQDGKVVFLNRAAERLLGFRAKAVLGRPCHEVMRGETLDGQRLCSASCAIGSRVARGSGVRNFDMRTHTKAGRMIWLNVSSLSVPSREKGRFLAVHLLRDISKQAKVRQLENELHAALCGTVATGPEIQVDHPAKEPTPEIPIDLPLSERERDVLRLLAAGKSTKSIADRLHIRLTTVRNHIQHILKKLHAHSRYQALAILFHSDKPPS